jgi:hypothetical protein
MTIACPMTKAAASEHSQTMAAAISSGVPILPTGSCAITLCSPSWVPPVNRCIAGIDLAEDNDAGVGNLLTVVAIVDGYVRLGDQ